MTGGAESAWDRIASLLGRADFTALTLAVVDLSPDERRAVVAPLRAFVGPGKYNPSHPFNEAEVVIVGAGVLPDVKSVAAWLNRYGMQHHRLADPSGLGGYVETSVVPNVFYVLTERGVPWLGDLAERIAERLPRTADYGTERFELVCRLLEHTGTPVPTTPGFVAGWVHGLGPDIVAAELAAHPDFAVLVPLFFDVEEVGAALSHDPRWPTALAEVVARGDVDRGVLLDACLARLGRPGRPGATRAFLAVHDALAPTLEEVRDHSGAYVAALGSPVSTVASMAQRRLYELDDHGLLLETDRLAVAGALLRRKEKKLVRAQLSRIAGLLPADVERRGELARLIASSWEGADADIVRLGMRTIAAIKLSAPVADAVLGAASDTLPPDLAAHLADLLGKPAAPQTAQRALPTQPRRLQPMAIDAITDNETLVAETVAILTGHAADLTTTRLETVIDGLLRSAAQNPAALRQAFRPALDSDAFRWLREFDDYGDSRSLCHAVWALATAAAGDTPYVHPLGPEEMWAGAETVLAERVFALALTAPLPPLSICLPTWTNGLLDPDALIDRLGRAATAGWQPPPQELEQALLRLDTPEEPDQRAALALTFAGLGTDAGRAVAKWIDTRRPAEPVIARDVVVIQQRNWDNAVVGQTELVDVAVRPGSAPDWPGGVWAGLVEHERGRYPASEGMRSPRCWPALAPRHRDVVAAHCVPLLAEAMDSSSRIAEVLPVLAEVDGAIGEATALALGYGLCTSRADQRGFAQRGLRLMCARPEWDGATLGRILGELFVRRSVVMKRAVEPLRQVAADGCASALWPTLREVVAALLPITDLQPGLGDVLSLAAELAQQAPAAEAIPGLSDFASRPGKSRQLVEARRLASLLSR